MACPCRPERRLCGNPPTTSTRSAAFLSVAFTFASLLALLVLSTAAQAGVIHPQVADELSRLRTGEQTTVMFVLENQADIAALNQALKISHATRQERHKRVVEALQKAAREYQPAFLAALDQQRSAGQVSGYTRYWITNLVVVRGTREAIESLAGRTDVSIVEPSVKPELMAPVDGVPPAGRDGERGIGVTPGLRAIRAPEVWYQLGINGTGAIVAGLDTGVDGNHPALATRWRGYQGAHPWQECWHDVLGTNTQFPTDTGRHGTHTMGTMTGLGAATQDTIGAAWGAQWIAANAINQGVGSEFDNDVVNCFQWLADPDGNPNTVADVPDVVQNSWRINEGFGGNYTDCDSRWWAVIDNCEAASVCVNFSAGNEGPGAQTIGSPPDRATTAYNCFSIGAVNATNASWPYPIAGWSSRGPTGCNVPAELRIKPEVSAPGVSVYSSVPGGGYEQNGWDGTSMAGPHVSGTVGLMRAANPDIDVESIKQILMETARDEGTAGEDNTYGWGFIDAYAAVTGALTGYGTLAGTVRNGSSNNSPISDAHVRLVEVNRSFITDAAGNYSGLAPASTYTVEVTHPSFATLMVPGVVITAGQITTQNFTLTDNLGPVITDVRYPEAVANPLAPIVIRARVTDFSTLGPVQLTYRVNGGSWTTTAMSSLLQGQYMGSIPGQAVGSHIDFYITATDVANNTSLDPPNAPSTFYSFVIQQQLYADNAETDQGWVLSQPGDATAGRWVRVDPFGTIYVGQPAEPADDHTPSPGTQCFVTGLGTSGGPASGSDVDAGCVTLTSPTIDLLGAQEANLSYWRWYAQFEAPDASFQALVSNNNGSTWTSLETLNSNQNAWNQVSFNLRTLIPLTAQMKFRFVACDTGSETLVEAAIDDIMLIGVRDAAGVLPLTPTSETLLLSNRPNPFEKETNLSFRIGANGPVSLTVYDPSGRTVRTLVQGNMEAGEHSISWNGLDDAGHRVAAGMYFYELKAEGTQAQRKMLMLQ